VDSRKAREIVEAFQDVQASIRRLVREQASRYVGDGSSVDHVARAVERIWFRRSRELGMSQTER